MHNDWSIGNDNPARRKPDRMIWFLYRRVAGGYEYLESKTGHVREFRSRAGAGRALRELRRVT